MRGARGCERTDGKNGKWRSFSMFGGGGGGGGVMC